VTFGSSAVRTVHRFGATTQGGSVIGTLEIVAIVAGVVVVAVLLLAVRRWLIRRQGGTFDCSVRLSVSPEDPAFPTDSGKGWVFGICRYTADAIEWYRMFSYAPRRRLVFPRHSIEVVGQRVPAGQEELALLAGWRVLECRRGGDGAPFELGMSEDALTGLLSWLEAAPPGQHVQVA
jgi:hypothetical protein